MAVCIGNTEKIQRKRGDRCTKFLCRQVYWAENGAEFVFCKSHFRLKNFLFTSSASLRYARIFSAFSPSCQLLYGHCLLSERRLEMPILSLQFFFYLETWKNSDKITVFHNFRPLLCLNLAFSFYLSLPLSFPLSLFLFLSFFGSFYLATVKYCCMKT